MLKAIAGLGVGYFAGAGIGYAAIIALSRNAHDKAVEAAMTAAFVTGPIGAVLGLVTGIVWARLARSRSK